MAVGQTNGEFLVLSTSDLSVLQQKRDRSKTLQVVRCVLEGSLSDLSPAINRGWGWWVWHGEGSKVTPDLIAIGGDVHGYLVPRRPP